MSPSSRPSVPATEAARARRARAAALAEEAHDVPCVWVLDEDGPGAVVDWPAGAEALYGVPPRAAVGRARRLLLDSTPTQGTWADVAAALRTHGRWEGELAHTTPHGHTLLTETRCVRAPDLAGDATTTGGVWPPLVVEIARDVTAGRVAEGERERLIDALERERAQLAEFALHADAARAEADAARRDAEAASQAKSAFLATMSHELRTPLNAVLGYAELLELGLAGPVAEAQRQYLDRITASGRHLLGLITDVLDLSRIEAGEMTVARQPHAAHDAVREAAALVRPHAVARGVVLDEPEPNGPAHTYLGDQRRVQQILTNLLANAVKFTEPGGHVGVRCGLTREGPPDGGGEARGGGRGAWVTLTVRDTGIGIPEEQLELVFARFHQVEPAGAGPYRRTQGGTGLGLAISRELSRLMGGDLTVESVAGRGSAFTLWLPAAVPAVRPAEPPAREPKGGASVGSLLAEGTSGIIAAWVERLRTDPIVAGGRTAARAELEDHIPSYLADIAQQFVIFDDPHAARGRVSLVRDGTAVRTLLARQHGRQRARLGWGEPALAREWAMLREEMERVLAAGLSDVPPGTVDDARALAWAWLAAGARESADALRAAYAEDSAPPGVSSTGAGSTGAESAGAEPTNAATVGAASSKAPAA